MAPSRLPERPNAHNGAGIHLCIKAYHAITCLDLACELRTMFTFERSGKNSSQYVTETLNDLQGLSYWPFPYKFD